MASRYRMRMEECGSPVSGLWRPPLKSKNRRLGRVAPILLAAWPRLGGLAPSLGVKRRAAESAAVRPKAASGPMASARSTIPGGAASGRGGAADEAVEAAERFVTVAEIIHARPLARAVPQRTRRGSACRHFE